MMEVEKLIASEDTFQRRAILIAILLLIVATLPLSVARAIFDPAQQIAAAVGPLPAAVAFNDPEEIVGRRAMFFAPRAQRRINPIVPAGTSAVMPLPGVVPQNAGPVPFIPTAPGPLSIVSNDPSDSQLADTVRLNGDLGPGGTLPRATIDPVSPVPEPATWLMMILGVGLVGGTLRRARARGLMPALSS